MLAAKPTTETRCRAGLSGTGSGRPKGGQPTHRRCRLSCPLARGRRSRGRGLVLPPGAPGAPTQRDDQEAHVAQPVGGLVGQLLHEQPQHGAEVVLRAGHRDLHGRRRLRVAVAAVSAGGTGDRCLREPARLPGAQPRTPLPKLGVVTTRWSGSPPPHLGRCGPAQTWEKGACGWSGRPEPARSAEQSRDEAGARGARRGRAAARDSLSLYPGDDGAEGRLHVGSGAGAHHGERVALQGVREELRESGR